MITVRPSSVLRARDDETRRAETALFGDDMKKVAQIMLEKDRRS